MIAGGKYLSEAEQARIFLAIEEICPEIRALCLVLAMTGCRISEALALTSEHHDADGCTLTFRTLKRRKTCFRIVPIPRFLSAMLSSIGTKTDGRYWPMHRSTAWRHLKSVFSETDVSGPMACCRGFRHGFGIHAATHNVPPNLIQRWMGHALPSTTAIYLDAVGAEERQFAERLWPAHPVRRRNSSVAPRRPRGGSTR